MGCGVLQKNKYCSWCDPDPRGWMREIFIGMYVRLGTVYVYIISQQAALEVDNYYVITPNKCNVREKQYRY